MMISGSRPWANRAQQTPTDSKSINSLSGISNVVAYSGATIYASSKNYLNATNTMGTNTFESISALMRDSGAMNSGEGAELQLQRVKVGEAID